MHFLRRGCLLGFWTKSSLAVCCMRFVQSFANIFTAVWEVAAEAERQEKRNKLAAQGGNIKKSIEERKAAADGLHSQ